MQTNIQIFFIHELLKCIRRSAATEINAPVMSFTFYPVLPIQPDIQVEITFQLYDVSIFVFKTYVSLSLLCRVKIALSLSLIKFV